MQNTIDPEESQPLAPSEAVSLSAVNTAYHEAKKARAHAKQLRAHAQIIFEANPKDKGRRWRAGQASRTARALEFYASALEAGLYPWVPGQIDPRPFETPGALAGKPS